MHFDESIYCQVGVLHKNKAVTLCKTPTWHKFLKGFVIFHKLFIQSLWKMTKPFGNRSRSKGGRKLYHMRVKLVKIEKCTNFKQELAPILCKKLHKKLTSNLLFFVQVFFQKKLTAKKRFDIIKTDQRKAPK